VANIYTNAKIDFNDTSNTTVYTSPTATTSIIKSILVSEDSGNADSISVTLTAGASVFNLFKTIINDTSLDKEIKNLVIYKKALFYAAEIDDNENDLLNILNPLINSESVWKSHALYLMGEYYFSKNQKQKSKEFYEKIIASENTNPDIKKEVQKRLNRDFSE